MPCFVERTGFTGGGPVGRASGDHAVRAPRSVPAPPRRATQPPPSSRAVPVSQPSPGRSEKWIAPLAATRASLEHGRRRGGEPRAHAHLIEAVEGVKSVASTAAATALRDELTVLRSGGGSRKQLGDFSEAVFAGLAAIDKNHGLLQQHNPGDSSRGIDVQTVDPEGKVWSFEVKGTLQPGKLPTGTRYDVGRQGSGSYVANRSQGAHVTAVSADAVGAGKDQMGSLLVGVNLPDNVVTLWEVDAAGNRVGIPMERYNLDEVVDAIVSS